MPKSIKETAARDKKILMVTPEFAYPPKGADNKDRVAGIKNFVRHGFEVEIVARFFEGGGRRKEMEKLGEELGIKMFFVAYLSPSLSNAERIKRYLKRFFNPLYLDGAAFEYSRKEMKDVFKSRLSVFRPDYAHFDYTFCWPLYGEAKKRGAFVVTRSHNFEARHFLEECGYGFFNYFRFLPKLLTEFMAVQKSDLIFSVSPEEERIYKKLGAKKVINLPIRALPLCLSYEHKAAEKEALNVFYFASSYNVSHNRRALEFILKEIAPKTYLKFPHKFKFHFIGTKFPEELKKYLNEHVIYEGFVGPDYLEDFLLKMDIALSPSLSGCGMQQKIFEPLARGFPTVTNERGLVGYPFSRNKEVLLAKTAEEFVSAIGSLLDFGERKRLSGNAKARSKEIFSQDRIDDTMLSVLAL